MAEITVSVRMPKSEFTEAARRQPASDRLGMEAHASSHHLHRHLHHHLHHSGHHHLCAMSAAGKRRASSGLARKRLAMASGLLGKLASGPAAGWLRGFATASGLPGKLAGGLASRI